MQIKTREHEELIAIFEHEFANEGRLDKETKDQWAKGRIYQDDRLNELFLAYRRGYALARCVYLSDAA